MLTIAKLWESAREPIKNMFTQEPSAQLRAETLYSGTNPEFWQWVFKKKCVYIGAELKIVLGYCARAPSVNTAQVNKRWKWLTID